MLLVSLWNVYLPDHPFVVPIPVLEDVVSHEK
jgi:hypothetical protein